MRNIILESLVVVFLLKYDGSVPMGQGASKSIKLKRASPTCQVRNCAMKASSALIGGSNDARSSVSSAIWISDEHSLISKSIYL